MSDILLDLAGPVEPVTAQALGGEVYDRFVQEADVLAIPVVDDRQRPIGLLERNDFFVKMGSTFGRALYTGRPVTFLMNPRPLVVDGDVEVAEFCRAALSERPSELMRGFIVTCGGRYAGVVTAVCLLQATSAANKAHAEEMSRLAATLRQATLDAEAALKAKSEFLAVMSHEIRTPLNGVLAIAEIVQRKLKDKALKSYVGAITDSGQTLLRLLNDALDISRAEAGRLELDEQPFEPRALAHDLATLWQARAEVKAVAFNVRYEGPEDLWLLGDAVRLKQVFGNLIGNALKFTEAGAVDAALRLRSEDGVVRLQGIVSDTGPGVPHDQLDSIFAPFNQTEAGLQKGGSGLGLTICRDLMTKMGGTIVARRNEGPGLTVTFDAAFFALPAPAALDEATSPMDVAAEAGALHILIADDNPTNRLVATTLCEMFGFTSAAVEDGAAALREAQTGAYDLVLMDIKMPVLDGVAATARIRALPGPARSLPILALTANASAEDAQLYRAAGMDGVVEKPIQAERLGQAIAALFAEGPSAASDPEPATRPLISA